MDQRTMHLLSAIVNAPGIELQSLQKKFALQEHQVEYHLKKANRLLEEQGYPVIERQRRKVWVTLDGEDLQQLLQILQEEQIKGVAREARISLVPLLIFTTQRASLSFLAQRLNVSKNTVVNDLATVKEAALQYNVTLHYTRKQGYHFLGSEIAIRILLIRQLHALLEMNWHEEMLTHFVAVTSKEIYQAKEQLICVEKKLHTQFSDRQIRLLSLLIPMLRIRCSHQGEICEAECQKMMHIVHAQDFRRVEKAMKDSDAFIGLEKGERAFLIIQLLSANVVHSKIDEAGELHKVVNKVIARFEIRAVIHFEPAQTGKLKQMLYQHLGPAIYRLKYGIPYEDHAIESIIREYQGIFPLAREAIKPLEEAYHIRFTEIEIIYVGLIFQSFLTNSGISTRNERIRAIVICANGISVSNLLFETLVQAFPMIDFVANLSAREFYDNPLVYRDIHVVFSTIQLKTGKKTFILPPLLSEGDKQRLIEMVNQELFGMGQSVDIQEILAIIKRNTIIQNEDNLREDLLRYLTLPKTKVNESEQHASKFQRFLPRERIKVSTRRFTFAEAIQAVAEPLLNSGMIEQRFTDKIIETYDERYPYFVIAPGIAIPHAGYHDGVKEMGFSFLLLKHPVRFSADLEVRALLMIAPIDNKQHQKAVQSFYQCVSNEEKRQALLSQKSATGIEGFFRRHLT